MVLAYLPSPFTPLTLGSAIDGKYSFEESLFDNCLLKNKTTLTSNAWALDSSRVIHANKAWGKKAKLCFQGSVLILKILNDVHSWQFFRNSLPHPPQVVDCLCVLTQDSWVTSYDGWSPQNIPGKKLASMLGMAVPVACVSPLKVHTLLSAEPNLCLIATSESWESVSITS